MVWSLSIRAKSNVLGSDSGQRISTNEAYQLSLIFCRISQDASVVSEPETPFSPSNGKGMCPDTRK